MQESNIEITPIFEETHRVQFTSLGESLDKDEYSFKLVDGKLNLSNYSTIVSRTNYKLIGWSDGVTEYRYTFDTDGVTITNSDSLIVTVSDNVVFSAIWETSMEVEFKLNNSANNNLFRSTLNE